MRWIGAQRTAPSGERSSSGRYRLGRLSLFHPVHRRGQHVETIQRRAAAAAVPHTGRKEQAAPLLHLRLTAIRYGHSLVVIDSVLRGKPRIAQAVIEDQLASVRGKTAEVDPTVAVADPRQWIVVRHRRFGIHILRGRRDGTSHRAGAGIQQARNAAALRRNAGVIRRSPDRPALRANPWDPRSLFQWRPLAAATSLVPGIWIFAKSPHLLGACANPPPPPTRIMPGFVAYSGPS